MAYVYLGLGEDHREILLLIAIEVAVRKRAHLVVDNYATHKHPKVRAWLARRPRWHLHFTPT